MSHNKYDILFIFTGDILKSNIVIYTPLYNFFEIKDAAQDTFNV